MNRFDVDYYLRTSDFDMNSRIHPAAVLDLFQEVAGGHATLLGCSFAQMLEKNLLWMVTRVRFSVIKMPEKNSYAKVSTWPLEPNRVIFQREYSVTDEQGEALIRGSSEWAAVDCNERKLVAAKGIYPESIEYLTDKTYEGRLPRLHDFDCEKKACTVTPTYSDIDCNGHVNNTKYAIYVMNCIELGSDEEIYDFQIDYHKEIQQGDNIDLYCKREGNTIFAKGLRDKDTMFLCKIEIKK